MDLSLGRKVTGASARERLLQVVLAAIAADDPGVRARLRDRDGGCRA
jgi:hypothetical protein